MADLLFFPLQRNKSICRIIPPLLLDSVGTSIEVFFFCAAN